MCTRTPCAQTPTHTLTHTHTHTHTHTRTRANAHTHAHTHTRVVELLMVPREALSKIKKFYPSLFSELVRKQVKNAKNLSRKQVHNTTSYVCLCVYLCVCLCVYRSIIWTHSTHTHTHTRTHTHTHTHTCLETGEQAIRRSFPEPHQKTSKQQQQ